jgi:hypothetical protein
MMSSFSSALLSAIIRDKSHQGIISYSLASILTIKHSVFIKEPYEDTYSDALVAIRKRVVFDDEVQ